MMDVAAVLCAVFVHAMRVAVPTAALSPTDQPYVRYVNVAVGKPAFSSSVEFPQIDAGQPKSANDGISSPDPTSGKGCFQAASNDVEPYWLVDLGRQVIVTAVRLTNRGDCCGNQLTDFKIELFADARPATPSDVGTACVPRVRDPVAQGATEQFNCFGGSVTGRWLRIQKLGPLLTICEVSVLEAEQEKYRGALNCDFDDPDVFGMCGFYSAPSSPVPWTRGKGSTPTLGTGPKSDHTTESTTGAGHYMYMDRASMQNQAPAELVSSPISGPHGDYCLTFWYHMHGAGDGLLQVRILPVTLQAVQGITEWTADGRRIDKWRRAEIPFALRPGFDRARIVFFAVPRGATAIQDDIAIDDVSVVDRACPSQRTVPVSSVDCDFDQMTGEICGWGQSFVLPTNAFWLQTNRLGSMPEPRNESNYYLHLSKMGPESQYSAATFSPLYSPTFIRSCLRFRYSIAAEGVLAVLASESSQYVGGGNVQWQRKGSPTPQWTSTQVDLFTPSPLRVVFFGGVVGMTEEVSVDDVTLTAMDCSAVETLSCTFDQQNDFCGFFQSDTNDFNFGLRSDSTGPIEGPQADHTSSVNQQPSLYLFSDMAANLPSGSKAVLHSPIISNDARVSCLVFWYQLRGPDPQGTLKVFTSDSRLTQPKVVWSLSQGYRPRDLWSRATVTIGTEVPTRVNFWVNITNTNYTVAIDDISVTKGACLSEQAVRKVYSCDLENEDLCGIGQEAVRDNFEWTWMTGKSSAENTGPEADHTTGSGYYLVAESSTHAGPGEKAVLYTPAIAPSFPKSCLTFAYHMHGATVGTLRVGVAVPGKSSAIVWSKTGAQGPDWISGKVELDTTSPYKIFVEAVKGGSGTDVGTGDIAIDDINIVNSDCDRISHIKCTFDDMCTFMQWPWDAFDWTRISGPTPGFPSGPRSDRTNPSGSYLYMKASTDRKLNDNAGLLSRVMDTGTPISCLEFWYHFNIKPGTTGWRLAVMLSSRRQPLWTMTRSQGADWRRVALTIDTSAPARIVIEGRVGSGGESTIAIDDIELNKGACLHDRVVSTLKCDFNEPGLCGWGQKYDDNFDWTWHKGPTPGASVSGPFDDHAGKGHYVYIETSTPQKQGEKATLTSPKIRTVQPKSCLTFWYHMKGTASGTLKVAVLLSPNQRYEIWSRKGAQGNGWQEGSVQLDSSPSPFQVLFEGTVGAGSAGDIAIDDVELIPRPCIQKASVNCDFNEAHICGYKRLPSNGTNWSGPGQGSFLYAGESTTKAVLVSPSLYWKRAQGCLSFKVEVSDHELGTLNVYKAPTGLPNEQTLLFTSGPKTQPLVKFDVQTHHPVQLIFEGVRRPGFEGNITLDDIKVMPEQCALKALDCDFSADMCGYTPSAGNREWKRQTGEITPGVGPLSDHTDGAGHYIFSDIAPGEQAVLQSRILDWGTEKNCLSFWYSMHGANTGQVSVFVASPYDMNVDREDLWSRQGNQQDREWHLVQVQFNASRPLRLYLSSSILDGTNTTRGNVAVDDILTKRGRDCSYIAEPSTVDCDFEADLCGYTQLTTDEDDWTRSTDGVPGTGVVRLDPFQTDPTQTTAVLESPVLRGDPRKICLKFRWITQVKTSAFNTTLLVHVVDVGTGSTIRQISNSEFLSQGWQMEEVDLDYRLPMLFRFEATRPRLEDRQMVDIALDYVEVATGICHPIPMTEGWEFRCDRPTTPCNNLGTCDPVTKKCKCVPDAHGLTCTAAQLPCPVNMCVRGDCYIRRGYANCDCPDGYYGDKCQHDMVHVECTHKKMAVNIFPYGYSSVNFRNIKPPELVLLAPENVTYCTLLPLATFQAINQEYRQRAWQGYAKEFFHVDDPCAGNASVVTRNGTTSTYQRQVHVYYDPLGRHLTDTIVNVTCSAPNRPPPTISMDVKELGTSIHSKVFDPRRGWPTYVQFKFAVNIPNSGNINEIKAEECIATYKGESQIVVKNGCVVHPVGVMLNTGTQPGTEELTLRVFKVPGTSANLKVRCNFRLCDTTANDFSCYRRDMCLSLRPKRSPRWTRELVANVELIDGGHIANIS